jgi:putative protease
MFGTEEAIRRELKTAAESGVRYALCNNVGAIPLALEAGLIPVGGFGLNLTNGEAVAAYAAEGLRAATLSMELTFGQMGFAKNSPIPTGVLLYGRQPLMLTRNCPRQCDGASCAACTPTDGVTDRRGVTFPTACAGGCTELLNSVPLYWADRLEDVPQTDFYLLHFTVETPDEVERMVEAYRHGATPPPEITRGLYRRGVE